MTVQSSVVSGNTTPPTTHYYYYGYYSAAPPPPPTVDQPVPPTPTIDEGMEFALYKALVATENYQSNQDRAVKIIELLQKGEQL